MTSGSRTMAACLAVGVVALLAAAPATAVVSRDEQPVLVTGSSFPGFSGRAIADLALYRYNTGTAQFDAVPFQIDERIVDRVFSAGAGTSGPFTETVYDIFGEDDGLLDNDDELAFLFGDAGPQAPATGPWVAGADPQRYEIHLTDPRTGATDPDRYVYLFAGTALPLSGTDYITWTVSAATDVTTPQITVEFSDRWVMDGFSVAGPCGDGADLIDRFKGRAGLPGADINQGETEQLWNTFSSFLGGIEGPVRAIRYIRGAASGTNTTHHDIVYRAYWERHIHLRVHNIPQTHTYFDWLPASNASLYLSTEGSGLTVDGDPDSPTTTDLPTWTLYRSSSGGMASLIEVPPSAYYNDTDLFYKDDDGFNDSVGASYTDDDDMAIGDVGVYMTGITVGDVDSIYSRWSSYALCADTGDVTLGQEYRDLDDMPLGITSTQQDATVEAVRTLLARRDADDVVLEWQAIAGATGYRVYASDFPDLPKLSWTVLGDTATTDYRDVDAILSGIDRHYSVVALGAGGEGDH